MKKYMVLMAGLATLMAACDKGFESVSEPTLDLSTTLTTYFVQEPVVFNIESNANFLSFYSGERGNDYAYVAKERIYEGEAWISFNSAFQAGSQWKTQLDEDLEKRILRLFYSSDFSGIYTLEEVEKATWVELTSEFEYPTARATNAKVLSQTTPAGERKLTDLIPAEELDKPLYFAFRYKIDPYVEELANARSRACVMNFQIVSRCDEINANDMIATQGNAGWQFVTEGYEDESGKYAPEISSSYIWFDCDGGLATERICWAISAPIHINTEVNIGCDYGVGIKGFPDEPLTSYTYTYAEPGEYEVFVTAANVDYTGARMEKTASVKIQIVEQGNADIEQPGEGEW